MYTSLRQSAILFPLITGLVVVALTIWYARSMQQEAILQSAIDYSNAISDFRSFYSEIILENLEGSNAVFSHDYRNLDNAIPIPATLSQDLSRYMAEKSNNAMFNVVSQHPFPWRFDRTLTDFQNSALTQLKNGVQSEYYRFMETPQGTALHYASPIRMKTNCVNCHNTSPLSPKTDWREGDIRGIEEVIIQIPPFNPLEHAKLLSLLLFLLISLGSATYLLFKLNKKNQSTFFMLDQSNEGLKDAYTNVERAKQDAERSAEVKSQFLAMVSHELRTPLNGIDGMAQLLATTNPTKEQLDYIGIIHSSSNALLSLINEILDLSKLEAGKMELQPTQFSPTQLIDNTALLLSSRFHDKGLDFSCEIDPNMPEQLYGDEGKLRQVLINLLGNAAKFTHQGSVKLNAMLKDLGEQQVEVKFSVKDTGVGIARSKMGRIFKQFEQVNNSSTRHYGGTGLGLAICKQLVELMGGSISVESHPDIGSEFMFTVRLRRLDRLSKTETESGHVIIPVSHQTEKTAPDDQDESSTNTLKPSTHPQAESIPHTSESSNAADTDDNKRNKLNLLLVEDNSVNQKVASAILAKAGHDVAIADNGKIALEMLANNTYDLILMDLQMPEMDGLQATKAIRDSESDYQQIPIIVLTANCSEEDRKRSFDAGANSFIGKPIVKNQLLAEINKNVIAK